MKRIQYFSGKYFPVIGKKRRSMRHSSKGKFMAIKKVNRRLDKSKRIL